MSIRVKIIAISVVILFVSMAMNLFVTTNYFSKEYTSARKDEVFVLANSLKSQLDRLLRMHIPLVELVGFEDMCQDAVSQHSILSYAMVLDLNGKILFHNDPSKHQKMVTDAHVLEILSGTEKITAESMLDGQYYYDVFIPVRDSLDKVIAFIRMGFPRSHIDEKTQQMALYSVTISSVSFMFGCIVLITFLSYWVSGPLIKLTQAIENIRKNWTPGDRKSVEISSRDEIGQLGKAFNQLISDLRVTTVTRDFVDNILQNMLNSLIIIDEKHKIVTVNPETLTLLGYNEDELMGKSIFDLLDPASNPITTTQFPGGSKGPIKAVETNYLSKKGAHVPILFSISPLEKKNERGETGFICVAQDMTEIKVLRGIIPICSSCKKIRDDKGYWNRVENYLSTHSKASFSHGVCPECIEKLYGEEDWYDKEKV